MDAHEAWRIFYDLYWQPIVRYACRLGLSDSEAHEVLQETMVTLMRLLPGFDYDRSRGQFRNFLLTIVHRKALGILRRSARQRRRDAHFLEEAGGDRTEVEGQRDNWRRSVVESVLAELRDDGHISAKTFSVFVETVLRRRPAAEVGREHGLKENAVYQIKCRILRRVKAGVVRRLRDSGDPFETI
jgi:RNA polymerase sigma-70 factor (ECF subfamily)